MDRSRSPPRDCAICLNELKDETTFKLECGHELHSTCLVNWFRRNPSCPVCRANPDSDDDEIEVSIEELAAFPMRALTSIVSEPLRRARRADAPPRLRIAARAFRNARATVLEATRNTRETRNSEEVRAALRRLRTAENAENDRRRIAAARAAEIITLWNDS